MTNKIVYVNILPTNISTFYYDKISKDTAQKRLRALDSLDYHRSVLVVEEISSHKYILIEGFREYSAIILLQPNKLILCNLVNSTNEKKRLLRILKKVITLEATSWCFKHFHIKKLINDYHMNPIEISNAINQPISFINRYLYHDTIPDHIRRLSDINNASKTLLNKIARSQILNDNMRILLFERAVRPKNHPQRLKERQLEHVKLFLNNFSLSKIEHDNPNFNASLLDSLLEGDMQLLSYWENLLLDLRRKNKSDYTTQYNYYNPYNKISPLQ
ncbi:hypothetical protein GGQ84_001391 [Desulfitispora alkaliphila]|uniref:hypothetical protein n=1 Tax=Desulfitispora alkaliphila TaxID=622674 RepID=UPI003D2558DD